MMPKDPEWSRFRTGMICAERAPHLSQTTPTQSYPFWVKCLDRGPQRGVDHFLASLPEQIQHAETRKWSAAGRCFM